MFKTLQKFFKKSFVSNERGSALAVTLIVITILTFAIANITSVSVNLAGTTTVLAEGITDDNTAKGYINQTIDEYKTYLINEGSYENYLNVVRYDNVYGVQVTDVTTSTEGYESGDTVNNRVFRFAYPLSDGSELVKYVYSSYIGTELGGLKTFDFSIGTADDLVLNGGLFTGVKIYGDDVYLADQGSHFNYGKDRWFRVPDNGGAGLPNFSSGDSSIYFNESLVYQLNDINKNPYNFYKNPYPGVNEVGTKLRKDNFVDDFDTLFKDNGDLYIDDVTIPASQEYDLFGEFDFDEYVLSYILSKAPTVNREITVYDTSDSIETIILDNTEPRETVNVWFWETEISDFWLWLLQLLWGDDWASHLGGFAYTTIEVPDSPFILISGDDGYGVAGDDGFDFNTEIALPFSGVYNGDLTISKNLYTNDFEALIVIGDLEIDFATSGEIIGNIFCTGDLTFTGKSVDVHGSVMALGSVTVDFDDYSGITTDGITTTNGVNGITLISKDLISIVSMFQNNENRNFTPDPITAFVYTESSIFIDAVSSQVNIEGSLFARGTELNGNQMLLNDKDDVSIKGIYIVSYQGYVNASGKYYPLIADSANGFKIAQVDSSLAYDDLFLNLPAFNYVIAEDAGVAPEFGTSEFIYE